MESFNSLKSLTGMKSPELRSLKMGKRSSKVMREYTLKLGRWWLIKGSRKLRCLCCECACACVCVCRRLGGIPKDVKYEACYLLRFLCPVFYGSYWVFQLQRTNVSLSVVTGINLQSKSFSNVPCCVILLGCPVMEEI